MGFSLTFPKLVEHTIYQYPQEGGPNQKVVLLPDINSNLNQKYKFNHRRANMKFNQYRTQVNKRRLDDHADPVFERMKSRNERFNVVPEFGEHPCWAGFKSATSGTGRCGSFKRQPANEKRLYRNLGFRSGYGNYTLRGQTSNSNIWTEDMANVSPEVISASITAARIMDNEDNSSVYIPYGQFGLGGNSWLEEMCLAVGIIPFDFTCSNTINFLVIDCGYANAFVNMYELRNAYPNPANINSTNDFDNLFYVCVEYVEGSASYNPVSMANTFIHELAHVIQAGFGFSDTVSSEGGATWVESTVLGLPFRPMVTAWGFDDWNKLLAVNIYDQARQSSARKFYQIWATMLSFMAQDRVLGPDLTRDVWRHRIWDSQLTGRSIYDYFFSPNVTTSRPPPVNQATSTAFLDFMVNYRVALVGTCFDTSPTDLKYSWPSQARFWDCSSFPSYSGGQDGFNLAQYQRPLGYGGAHVVRLMNVQNPQFIDSQAGLGGKYRTMILTEMVGATDWTVYELTSDMATTLSGNYSDIFVVQINVDPMGEFISEQDIYWKHADGVWKTPQNGVGKYPSNTQVGIYTPLVSVPINGATLAMDVKWIIEAPSPAGQFLGCDINGWDGFQIRIHSGVMGMGTSLPTVLKFDQLTSQGYGLTQSALAEHYGKEYKGFNLTCEHFVGFAGDSKGWHHLSASLDQFKGQDIAVEVLFVSDAAVQDNGVWLDNVTITSGNQLLYLDDANKNISLTSKVYKNFTMGKAVVDSSGVPSLVFRDDGYIADYGGINIGHTTAASFSASWSLGSENSIRSWLGPGYSTLWQKESDPTTPPHVVINPWFEVMSEFHMVYEAITITEVTFYFFVEKLDVQALVFRIRSGDGNQTVLYEQRVPLVSVYMESIQRFILSTPLKISGCKTFIISFFIESSKQDPAGQASPNKQNIQMPLSFYVGRPENTWLVFTETKGNYTRGAIQRNPFDGGVIPVRILIERAPGTAVCTTPSPTPSPTSSPTPSPTSSPTSSKITIDPVSSTSSPTSSKITIDPVSSTSSPSGQTAAGTCHISEVGFVSLSLILLQIFL